MKNKKNRYQLSGPYAN